MRVRHTRQAKQLYKSLLAKGQTWSRPATALDEWAEQFQLLECDFGDRERIQSVLDWFCDDGVGALFVPMVGNAESFRMKFQQIEQAMNRMATQQLRYFDDLIDYEIKDRKGGTDTQREHWRVMQRMQQQVAFVDDLAHGRIKLPQPSRNGHSRNGKPKPKGLTTLEKNRLSKYVLTSRELLWRLLMDNPANEAAFNARLMNDKQLKKRLNRYFAKGA